MHILLSNLCVMLLTLNLGHYRVLFVGQLIGFAATKLVVGQCVNQIQIVAGRRDRFVAFLLDALLGLLHVDIVYG